MNRTLLAFLTAMLAVSAHAILNDELSPAEIKNNEMVETFQPVSLEVIAAAKEALEVGREVHVIDMLQDVPGGTEIRLAKKADAVARVSKDVAGRKKLEEAVIGKYGDALYQFQAVILNSGYRDRNLVGAMAPPKTWSGVEALTSASKTGGERTVCSPQLSVQPSMKEMCDRMARYHHEVSAMMTLIGASGHAGSAAGAADARDRSQAQSQAQASARANKILHGGFDSMVRSMPDADLGQMIAASRGGAAPSAKEVAAAKADPESIYGKVAKWKVTADGKRFLRTDNNGRMLQIHLDKGWVDAPVANSGKADKSKKDGFAPAMAAVRESIAKALKENSDAKAKAIAAADAAVNTALNIGPTIDQIAKKPVPVPPTKEEAKVQAAKQEILAKSAEASYRARARKAIEDKLLAKKDAAKKLKDQMESYLETDKVGRGEIGIEYRKAQAAVEDAERKAEAERAALKAQEEQGHKLGEKHVRDQFTIAFGEHPSDVARFIPDSFKIRNAGEKSCLADPKGAEMSPKTDAEKLCILKVNGVGEAWIKAPETAQSVVDRCTPEIVRGHHWYGWDIGDASACVSGVVESAIKEKLAAVAVAVVSPSPVPAGYDAPLPRPTVTKGVKHPEK